MTAQMAISDGKIILTQESLSAFERAMKIGYYKNMLNEGIINHTEFGKLLEIMNRKAKNA